MESIYKQYFESMPCYLTIQDRDLKLIDANEKFVDEFGDYEGRYCYQVYKQRPEKCENCPVEQTLLDGKQHTSEEVVKTVDGKEVCVIVNTMPIHDENGEITSVMEMSTDITNIKRLQNQLRESQNKYRLLFEEVPCYISIQDWDLSIVDSNRAFRDTFGTGYGKKCYEVYKHRTKQCMPCTVRQTFKSGKMGSHEEVVTSKNNETINVLVHTAPLKNADGDIENVIEMSTDITQIRKLQDKLSSIGLLIGSISHGIKGILGGLDGGIYMVNSGLKKDDNERINKGWDMVLRNVRRIRTMVLDILYYAKDREPNWENIDAAEMLNDVFRLMDDRAKRLKIELTTDIAPGTGNIEAERQAVKSLLVNLVENSIDACRTDTQKTSHYINLKLSGDKENVFLQVSDNGIGMDRETREKAFSLFFSSKGAGGTGLGLFISNKIIQAHGGSISLESELGKGSTINVIFPRKRPVKEDETESDVTDSEITETSAV